MLRYLKNNQIDYKKWDACVNASSQRIVYALSWYLDVVAPDWAGLVEEHENQYVTVMPLPQAKKFGINYVLQPFFCQQLGVFSISKEIDYTNLITLLLKKYRHISKLCFNTANTELSLSDRTNLIFSENYTHHLDLSHDYKTIYQRYSQDRKLNLKRAQKSGLTISASTDIKPLINLFRVNTASRITGGVAEETYKILERLYVSLQENGLVSLRYTKTDEEEIDSGCLFITYANKIIYIFNAASKAGRRRNGRSLMIDNIIQQYAGHPYIFDFESPPKVQSITRVYQGFGAEPVKYYSITYNNLPQPIKFIKQARQFLYQKVYPTLKAPESH